jgi:transposase-like protein
MTSASCQSDRAAAAPDWAAIRHAYVSQGVAVREICRSHGIHSQTLYRRAGQEAWPRRRESRNTAEERKTLRLLARLRRIAEGQIDEIEARRTTRTETSPGVPECDARALTALVKLMEHIAAIEAKHQVTRDGTRDGTGEKSQADRARRRAELANKLIAMLEQERGAPLPEEQVG